MSTGLFGRVSVWRCAHRRVSPLAGTSFSDLASWPGHRLAAAVESGLFPVDLIALEVKQRRQFCPACAEQRRRNRNHWATIVAAVVLVLLLACAAVSK